MAIRKVLLVGCKVGPWVPVAGLEHPEVRVQPLGTQVLVERMGAFMRVIVNSDPPHDHILVEVVG